MDKMLEIPTDRKPSQVGMLCMLMGLTALLFLSHLQTMQSGDQGAATISARN